MEFPLSKAQEVLKNEVVAVIGYGVQGPGQALNQKDNGINVIVGQRKDSKSWDKAVSVMALYRAKAFLKLKKPLKKEPSFATY
jgi:ketol-acid reductoisomerase